MLNNKILMFTSNLGRLDKYWVGEYEELGRWSVAPGLFMHLSAGLGATAIDAIAVP